MCLESTPFQLQFGSLKNEKRKDSAPMEGKPRILFPVIATWNLLWFSISVFSNPKRAEYFHHFIFVAAVFRQLRKVASHVHYICGQIWNRKILLSVVNMAKHTIDSKCANGTLSHIEWESARQHLPHRTADQFSFCRLHIVIKLLFNMFVFAVNVRISASLCNKSRFFRPILFCPFVLV